MCKCRQGSQEGGEETSRGRTIGRMETYSVALRAMASCGHHIWCISGESGDGGDGGDGRKSGEGDRESGESRTIAVLGLLSCPDLDEEWWRSG